MERELVVRYDPVRGPLERLRFAPRDDGRWALFDEVWSGCCWHTRGHDIVDELAIDATTDTIAALRD